MNSKKAKTIRRVAQQIADRKGLAEFALLAKSPKNPKTAVVKPQTTRGLIKTLKRAAGRGH